MRDNARGAHEGEGRAPGGQARPGPSWPLRKAVGALPLRQESQYPDKNRVQISAQSELRISGNLRNGERAESGSAETERDKETDPISEGPSPLPCHGSHGPEGETLLPSREKVKEEEEEGALSPPRFPWRRNTAGGHHHHHDIHQHLRHLHQHLHHLPPIYIQRSTLPQPVVPST